MKRVDSFGFAIGDRITYADSETDNPIAILKVVDEHHVKCLNTIGLNGDNNPGWSHNNTYTLPDETWEGITIRLEDKKDLRFIEQYNLEKEI